MTDNPLNKELFFLKTYLAHFEMLGTFMSAEEKYDYEKTKEKIRKIELQNKITRF